MVCAPDTAQGATRHPLRTWRANDWHSLTDLRAPSVSLGLAYSSARRHRPARPTAGTRAANATDPPVPVPPSPPMMTAPGAADRAVDVEVGRAAVRSAMTTCCPAVIPVRICVTSLPTAPMVTGAVVAGAVVATPPASTSTLLCDPTVRIAELGTVSTPSTWPTVMDTEAPAPLNSVVSVASSVTTTRYEGLVLVLAELFSGPMTATVPVSGVSTPSTVTAAG